MAPLYRRMSFPLGISLTLIFSIGTFYVLGIVLPDIRPWMHQPHYSYQRLFDLSKYGFNHRNVGRSCNIDDDEVWDKHPVGSPVKRRRVILGKGKRLYIKATEAMFKFDMINELDWAKIVILRDNKSKRSHLGDHYNDDELPARAMVATIVKCYNMFWSFNPSRLVCTHKYKEGHIRTKRDGLDSDLKPVRISQIAYSTVFGHLIAGEERWRVIYDESDTDDVIFEVISFTRGYGVLGKLAFPLIEPLQNKFFDETTEKMVEIIQRPDTEKRYQPKTPKPMPKQPNVGTGKANRNWYDEL
jgi:uncharacterized protein (UPF0548 family)